MRKNEITPRNITARECLSCEVHMPEQRQTHLHIRNIHGMYKVYAIPLGYDFSSFSNHFNHPHDIPYRQRYISHHISTLISNLPISDCHIHFLCSIHWVIMNIFSVVDCFIHRCESSAALFILCAPFKQLFVGKL